MGDPGYVIVIVIVIVIVKSLSLINARIQDFFLGEATFFSQWGGRRTNRRSASKVCTFFVRRCIYSFTQNLTISTIALQIFRWRSCPIEVSCEARWVRACVCASVRACVQPGLRVHGTRLCVTCAVAIIERDSSCVHQALHGRFDFESIKLFWLDRTSCGSCSSL